MHTSETHTGKFGAESVRGRKAECAIQRQILSKRGILGGKEFLTCAAGRNGFPLERVVFRHAGPRSGGAFCCGGRLLQPRRKIVKGMLTTCENYDMLFTQFRRARLTAFHCGSLARLQLCLSADPCIYTPGGDTTSAGGFVLGGRV